jgi:hypothetical protein
MSKQTGSVPSRRSFSFRKKLQLSLIVAGICGVLLFGIGELFLRLVPVPGVAFHTFYYDENTGGRHYPNSTWIYRSDRGEYTKRKVNSWGYPDVEHSVGKPAGVVRVGFFGDSFTEARQVPLENTFPRIIEAELNRSSGADSIEVISLGVSGRGTTQSYLESRAWADSLDLDVVCYVFCENDPGDNIPGITGTDRIPFALASGDSLLFDFSFRDRYRNKSGTLHRAWQYCKSRSLLCSVVQSRLMLIRRHGFQTKMDQADRKMAGKAKAGSMPRATHAPSSWPDSLREQSRVVTERVILRWKRDVESDGKRFVIVYLPRELELMKPMEEQDSWAAWLFDVCERNEIEIIDPTPSFRAAAAQGEEIYYDHLTKEGHRVLAGAFVDEFRKRTGAAPAQ